MFVKVKCEICGKIDKSASWSRKNATRQKKAFKINGYKCIKCYVKNRDSIVQFKTIVN